MSLHSAKLVNLRPRLEPKMGHQSKLWSQCFVSALD